MRHLPGSWHALEDSFRVKYSVKVRREAQRLLLLRRDVPIPPTRMLDTCWDAFATSPDELQEFLLGLVPKGQSEFSKQFPAYINSNLHRVSCTR